MNPLSHIAWGAMVLAACSGQPEPAPVQAPPPEPLASFDPGCSRCDVVLLNIGLLRADHIGLLGPVRDATPHIDRHFADAVVFDQAMAPSGATYFSATAIATATESMFNTHDINQGLDTVEDRRWLKGGGRWLVLRMLEKEGKHLVDELPTIAQTFSAAGYQTVALNDWIHTGRHSLLDRGYADYTDFTDTSLRTKSDRTTTVPLDEQLQQVRQALLQERDQPLLLYYHSNALHFPYPHPDLEGELVQRSTDDPELLQRAYQARVRTVDQALEPVFAALRERPGRERTLVLLYANHGLSLGEQGREIGVGQAWQGVVRAAFLLSHPSLSQGRHVRAPVSLADIAPTLYQLVGIEPLLDTGAHSFVPLLSGRGSYGRRYHFGQDLFQEYVRRENWKMLLFSDGRRELYDLARDPDETEDLSALHATELLELEAELEMERAVQIGLAETLRQALPAQEEGE